MHIWKDKERKKYKQTKGKCKTPIQTKKKKESKRFFCKKKGPKKKDYNKFKTWLENKSNPISVVYYELIRLMFVVTFG